MLQPLIRILFISLWVPVAAGCGKLTVSDGPDGQEEYTMGQVSLILEDPDASLTRAGWAYDDYFPSAQPTKEERWFWNGILAIFNSELVLECFAYYDYTISGNGIDNIGKGNAELITFPLGFSIVGALGGGDLAIRSGRHYFYFLGNIPQTLFSELKQFEAGKDAMTKDWFEKYVLRTADADGRTVDLITNKDPYNNISSPNGKSRGYMISNITSPQPRHLYSLDYTDPGSKYPFPYANGFNLYCGRATAKVSLAYLPPTDSSGEPKGKLTDVRYQLVNIPTQMFLMPNIFDDIVYTPHYEDFDETSDYGSADYTYAFDGRDAVDDTKWKYATLTGTAKDDMGYFYCMENSNAVPTEGNSTFALVRARFEPAEWLDKDGSPVSASADGTFWRIKDTVTGKYLPGYYCEVPLTSGQQEPVKYDGGITYYPVWLKTKGKYEVRRNGYYKIAITNVLSAGAPDLQSVITPKAKLGDPGTRTFSNNNGTGIEWQQGGI